MTSAEMAIRSRWPEPVVKSFAQSPRRGGLGLLFEPVDQTCDSIAKELGAEVDQKTQPDVCQTEIGVG